MSQVVDRVRCLSFPVSANESRVPRGPSRSGGTCLSSVGPGLYEVSPEEEVLREGRTI